MPDQVKTSVFNAQQSIVLVTGDIDSVSDLSKELKAMHVEVNLAKDANRALNLPAMKPNNWRASMYVIDLVLSGSSGFMLAHQLMEKYPDGKTPIILMTAHIAPEDVVESQQAGVLALLQKPVTFADIRNALEKEKARRLKVEQIEASFKNLT